MSLVPVYTPRPTPLHEARASVGAGFCCAFALVGALFTQPLVLVTALAAVLLAAAAAGVARQVTRSLRLSLPLALLIALINPLVYQGGETLLVRGGTVLGRRVDVTLEALVAGGVAGLRVVVLITALGLLSAAVDPDELLRLFRRFSYRSALTASLATRLVPVLARDASRMNDAARCRAVPPGRLAVTRAPPCPAPWSAPWTWPPRSRCAATRARAGCVTSRGAGRVTTSAWPARRSRWRRALWRHESRGRARCRRIRGWRSRSALPRRRCAHCSWPARPFPSPVARRGWGWPVAEPLVQAERFTYSYPEARRPALRELTLSIEPGSFTVLAGASGSGKSTLIRALCGLVPHFHGGTASGDLAVGGLDVRDHGPAELAGLCGTVFQDPETQVVMGGVRASSSCRYSSAEGLPRRWPARWRRWRSRWAWRTCSTAGPRPCRGRAPAGGDRRRPRAPAGAAAAGRADLQLDPVAGDELIWTLRRLNEEWGTAVVVAEHRLERCLPAADRVLAIEDGAVACDGPPPRFLDWAAGGDLATPVARMFSLAGIGPPPASVKAARTALRDAGLAPPAPAPAPSSARAQRRRSRSAGSGTRSRTAPRSFAAWISS